MAVAVARARGTRQEPNQKPNQTPGEFAGLIHLQPSTRHRMRTVMPPAQFSKLNLSLKHGNFNFPGRDSTHYGDSPI